MSSLLPDEIILNIFSRVPVKSILRFRCVSKFWCTLLSNPNFVKMHLNHATSEKNNNFSLLLREHKLVYSIDCDESWSESLCDEAVKMIDYPLKSPDCEVEILGSCDGLVCLWTRTGDVDVLCLWNPSTKEYKILPPPPALHVRINGVQGGFIPSPSILIHGFGCDSKIGDYKLVRVLSFLNQVYVYTLGSNSWKSIGSTSISYKFLHKRFGVLVSGALHWIGYDDSVSSIESIISFDITNERLEDFPCPDEVLGDTECKKIVGELGGCLCLLCYVDRNRPDVWVMQDYGSKETWIKLFTITQQRVPDACFMRPIHSDKNGEILFENLYRNLVVYDPKHKRARVPKICGISRLGEVESYIGSLVSLNSGTYVGQELAKESHEETSEEKAE